MSKIKKGVKVLVSSVPAGGKSTMASALEDVLVINFDYDKTFPFNVPHTVIHPMGAELEKGSKAIIYKGIKSLKESLVEKRNAYITAYNKYPKNIVIDTVTGMYGMMLNFNDKKFTGFDVHKANNNDTEAFNVLLDTVFAQFGMNVIIVAHANFNETTGLYEIPSQGSFKKRGGFISAVDYAIFINIEEDEAVIHHTTNQYPCRSLLEGIPEEEDRDTFSLQNYINKIHDSTKDVSKLEL